MAIPIPGLHFAATGERVGASFDHSTWMTGVRDGDDGRSLPGAEADGLARQWAATWGLAGGVRLAEFGEAVTGFAVKDETF